MILQEELISDIILGQLRKLFISFQGTPVVQEPLAKMDTQVNDKRQPYHKKYDDEFSFIITGGPGPAGKPGGPGYPG